MNVERINHSSCSLGSKLYVFGGKESKIVKGKAIQATIARDEMIECFDNAMPDQPWQILDLMFSNYFKGRTDPIVCKLNESEIVILGGLDSKKAEGYRDVWVFDTL